MKRLIPFPRCLSRILVVNLAVPQGLTRHLTNQLLYHLNPTTVFLPMSLPSFRNMKLKVKLSFR
jgi:hypothetical protein